MPHASATARLVRSLGAHGQARIRLALTIGVFLYPTRISAQTLEAMPDSCQAEGRRLRPRKTAAIPDIE